MCDFFSRGGARGSLAAVNDFTATQPLPRSVDPADANGLFELSFQNNIPGLKVYFDCHTPMNGGCIYTPDAQMWLWLSQTNRGGDPVQVRVRATNAAGTCVGCHSLSRDGAKMVAEAGGQNDGRLLIVDVATKTPMVPFGSTPKSIFESWNPDGNQFVGVYADNGATDYNLLLFDGDTGASLGTIDTGSTVADPADHPDWSPDGSRIAFTRMGIKGTNQRMFKGSIEMVTKDGADWSEPAVIVPNESGKNRYYPSFSPDGALLIFNESQCNSGETGSECNADTDPTAKLWIVPATPGSTAIGLDRANAAGIADGNQTKLTNSFPKWSPFVFHRDKQQTTRLEWLTFSSTRKYGLRSPPGNGTLIWMVAVDPDKAIAGQDPSSSAFAIPFQDLGTSNHIAQWTERVIVVQ